MYFEILGTKSVTSLGKNLKKAVDKKDKLILEKTIREAVSAGLPELADDIHEARKTLNLLQGGTGGQHILCVQFVDIKLILVTLFHTLNVSLY